MSDPEHDHVCACGAPMECFRCDTCAAHCLTKGGPAACWEAHEARRTGELPFDPDTDAPLDEGHPENPITTLRCPSCLALTPIRLAALSVALCAFCDAPLGLATGEA